MNIKISLYLDTRRKPQQGKYFIRLRLYDPESNKARFFTTTFKYSETDFDRIWKTKQPRNDVKEQRKELEALIKKAEETARKLENFSFDNFEKLWYNKPGNETDVLHHYQQTIERLNNYDRIGTALNYKNSKNAVIDFVANEKGQKPKKLHFKEITPAWLERFERFMRSDKTILKPDGQTIIKPGRKATTVGIYLRPLRALFNEAIDQKTIGRDVYPFGRRRYEIPAQKAVKKALTAVDLKALYNAEPATPEQQRAKDYFFFLFNCAGINIKDLAGLKYSDLQGETITYIREKTKRTTKADQKAVIVFLNEYTKQFIEKYGNTDRNPGNYIFPIYTPGMTPQERYKKSQNFTRYINQHLKLLAATAGITDEISTYWSRHTFATTAVRSGASLEQVSQALNHKDLSTTKAYFAGFEDNAMKQLTANLMNF